MSFVIFLPFFILFVFLQVFFLEIFVEVLVLQVFEVLVVEVFIEFLIVEVIEVVVVELFIEVFAVEFFRLFAFLPFRAFRGFVPIPLVLLLLLFLFLFSLFIVLVRTAAFAGGPGRSDNAPQRRAGRIAHFPPFDLQQELFQVCAQEHCVSPHKKHVPHFNQLGQFYLVVNSTKLVKTT